MLNSLRTRLDGHFVACAGIAAVAGVGGLAQSSEASIVYSGAVNLPVQTTTNGLYLNVVTGQINEPGNTSGGSVPGWDINIYGTTQTFYGFGNPSWAYVGSGGTVSVLTAGSMIDGSTANQTGSGSGSAFTTAGTPGYFGFAFQNEAAGNQVQYGWGRYVHVSGQAGTLFEYAYENSGAGIPAGAVPAPGSLALLALGAAATGRRRRA